MSSPHHPERSLKGGGGLRDENRGPNKETNDDGRVNGGVAPGVTGTSEGTSDDLAVWSEPLTKIFTPTSASSS